MEDYCKTINVSMLLMLAKLAKNRFPLMLMDANII